MNLERIFAEWQATRTSNPAQAHAVVVEAATTILSIDDGNMRWLAASLTDELRKLFTAALFVEAQAMPEALYEPMVRAAVYETSPLLTQSFVEPCVKAFGAKRVFQSLIDFLEKGTNYEKAGAVNALHWASGRKTVGEWGKQKPLNELLALEDYRRTLYLNTFIANPDLDLRRSIITYADLDEFTANAPVLDLIQKVVKIARTHPDEYIRHRVEVQLHRSPSAYPLPARKPLDASKAGKKSWWKQLWK